ncbi:MAG: Gmad2 immunoglobulin-like domain-containing protein [Chloroflexi bacterium]|nr:Gmad2 immunoglobulin-like domain-containing protein [Chloroflexota bacterium]
MMALWWGWPLLLGWLLVAGSCQVWPAQPDARPMATPTPSVSPTPRQAPPPPVSPTPAAEPQVTISAPAPGAAIGSPVRVAGRARVFEGTLTAIVYDGQGRELVRQVVQASAGAPEWGAYQSELSFPAPERQGPGRIEVVTYSARDGSLEHRAAVPVILQARSVSPTPTAASPQR